ncbi:SCP2 sterol-binding domain-containing protein [Lamprobacter modestohalophilus]|uniref:SCP2 sterol-binding domain-containing protein n=1 Tax=Lamprobacter modestohalophilus TaxID=1064514 RepID=UPI002ADED918|nr:SCP2 sterol-binding domain-containing protein [Lamprobacter modestohalophilus]MEA1050767.1 SCP2 sterol-binding domain-containing protein [Lamprobacter modestohalophilus]
MMTIRSTALAALLATGSLSAQAEVFMSEAWAKQACDAWNKNSTLTAELADWAKNDDGRGFKTIQMYRDKCGLGSKVELKISNKDGKAMCTYGGAVTNSNPDYGVDYLMHATDENWACMGSGECKAAGSMMTGKLKFSGPKMEAMGVMGPFNAFLALTGSVGGDKSTCP